jgi:hypothetical protein
MQIISVPDDLDQPWNDLGAGPAVASDARYGPDRLS